MSEYQAMRWGCAVATYQAIFVAGVVLSACAGDNYHESTDLESLAGKTMDAVISLEGVPEEGCKVSKFE